MQFPLEMNTKNYEDMIIYIAEQKSTCCSVEESEESVN